MKRARNKHSIHLGGQDNFWLGAYTWADGYLFNQTQTSQWSSEGRNYIRHSHGLADNGRIVEMRYTGEMRTNNQLDVAGRSIVCREAPGLVFSFLNVFLIESRLSVKPTGESRG